jgi:uncharacterized membrane protein YfcA
MKLNIHQLAALFDPSYIAECCALIAAIFLLRKGARKWQLFISFLLFTVIIETLGWYINDVIDEGDKYLWVYNLYFLVSAPFYLMIFSDDELLKPYKRQFNLNMFFGQGPGTLNYYTHVLEDILLAMVCCYLLYKNLKAEKPVDLFSYDYFWLANGLLFYSLGNITMYLFYKFLKGYYEQTHIPVGLYIINVLNVLLYGSLIVAFVCRRKNMKSPSES